MGLPYLRQNDPSDMQFVDLFHTWGDLLLTIEIANRANDACPSCNTPCTPVPMCLPSSPKPNGNFIPSDDDGK